jgi:phosphomannomutase
MSFDHTFTLADQRTYRSTRLFKHLFQASWANTEAQSLALNTAQTAGATYILAQDPDADRFSAAQRLWVKFFPAVARPKLGLYSADGTWYTFTGDQLGALFAAQVLKQYKESGKPIGMGFRLTARFVTHEKAENLAMVASTVSSKMVEAMAKVEGFMFVECLTGEHCSAHMESHTSTDMF